MTKSIPLVITIIDGKVKFSFQLTSDTSLIELIGALTILIEQLKKDTSLKKEEIKSGTVPSPAN